MKTLFIIYHEDLETRVRQVLRRSMVIARYTRIDDVVGARMVEQEQETGYMTDRRNHLIIVVADDELIQELVGELQKLRDDQGHGLRGFVVNATEAF
jgi:hypothetical protein